MVHEATAVFLLQTPKSTPTSCPVVFCAPYPLRIAFDEPNNHALPDTSGPR